MINRMMVFPIPNSYLYITHVAFYEVHFHSVIFQPPSKTRKVKVLKDEPVVNKPKSKPQPGTMAFLAQKDNSKPDVKPGGPTCGQCEIRAAVVVSDLCYPFNKKHCVL